MALLAEPVSITVQSNIGEDGPLTVQDGLRQVVDFFDSLSPAHGSEQENAIP